MAKTLFNILKKFRFLFVAALVMAVMSAPFITEAGSKKMSSAEIISVDDTMAGLGTTIEVSGDSYKPVEVAITKPDGTQILLSSTTDAKGITYVNLSDYHVRTAGTYTVEARNLTKDTGYGPSKTFKVLPGIVSAEKSYTELSKSSAQLGETIELTVSLQDNYQNSIDGHTVNVTPDKTSVSVYSPQNYTDKNGEMKFYLTGEKNAIATLTITDTTANKTLSETPKLAFSGGTYPFADAGGSIRTVWLASETGSISGFEISGLDARISSSASQTLTVTAVDEDFNTITDYIGTVRFSSTDDSATLPNDYAFTESDQGEHTFSLSFKFLTPGEQTLTVTDVESTTIEGGATFSVVTASEYDGDFQTQDFEREGDFTLINPTSGSYSSDDIEIQGEADYGYYAIIYVNGEEAGRSEVAFDNSFTYTLKDLDDETYVVYVDVVELDPTAEDMAQAEITAIVESSDSETITIDTAAPEVISISTNPKNPKAGEVVQFTVLSEESLDEASILFEGEVYDMTETATAGKYQVEITMPETDGEYAVDVVLMDQLGNEAQHRDQLSLVVGEGSSSDTSSDTTGSETTQAGEVGQVTGVTTTSEEDVVYLSWEAVESADGIAFYRIYYGPSADALYALSETYDSSTNWAIPGLVAGTYYFAIGAVDVNGNEGALSNVTAANSIGKTAGSSVEDIPTGTETPAITETGTPNATPDSGPAQTGIIILSLLATTGIVLHKRRAIC